MLCYLSVVGPIPQASKHKNMCYFNKFLPVYGCKGFLSRLYFCESGSFHVSLLRIYTGLNVAFSRWINVSGLFDVVSEKANSAAQRNISKGLNPETQRSSYLLCFIVPAKKLDLR